VFFLSHFSSKLVAYCCYCSVDWENGLNETILQDVESYLDKGKEGQEGVTGEGSLLQESQTVIHQRKSNGWCLIKCTFALELARLISGQAQRELFCAGPGITISAARYSSEDAAVLVEYVISIVEYTRLCGPLKHAIDHLQQLETERVKIQQAEAEDQKVEFAMATVFISKFSKLLVQSIFSLSFGAASNVFRQWASLKINVKFPKYSLPPEILANKSVYLASLSLNAIVNRAKNLSPLKTMS